MEYLAEISGGKTYFVKDGEIHHIFVSDNQCWIEGRSSTAVAKDLRPMTMATVAEV